MCIRGRHYGVPVTLPILTNDAGGTTTTGTATMLDPTTIDLDLTTVCVQRSKTLDGTGAFTANTTTGAVTFTPSAGFYG